MRWWREALAVLLVGATGFVAYWMAGGADREFDRGTSTVFAVAAQGCWPARWC